MTVRFCFECRTLSNPLGEQCNHCGKALDLVRNRTLIDGRFQPVSELGHGAMGRVQHATDLALERPVALKLIGEAYRSQPGALLAFYREAAALSSVRHENIAQLYSFGLHGDECYFAMEFVLGTPLDKVLAHYRKHDTGISIFRALTILRRVALGLSVVHAAGIVHCDLKPSNIVIEAATGRPVVVDFGIAVRSTGHTLSTEPPLGTPTYMAPEQIVPGRPLSAQTDLYSMGCLTYELLTGVAPFSASTVATLLLRHLNEPVPVPSAVDPRLAPVDALVRRAMAKVPAERFESALAYAHAIDAVLGLFDSSIRAPSPAARAEVGAEVMTRAEVALRIAIVDDDRAFAMVAQQALKVVFKGQRILVTVASSGDEAVKVLTAAPELVLLDLHMPGLDGIDTLAHLRELPQGNAMRVLVCSAAADDEARERFSLLGVTDFCAKPLSFGALVTRLKDLSIRNGWDPDERTRR